MSKRQKKVDLSHFTDWEKVGSGQYSEVSKAKFDGETVAIKKQQHTVGRSIDERNFYAISIINEMNALRTFGNHPNIVSYIMDISDHSHTYIVLKYYSQTLRGMVKEHKAQKKSFSKDFIIRVMFQILSAVQAAHDGGVVHCDIKPANVFIDESKAVVGDWGMCRYVPSGGILYLQKVATLWYRAPELLLRPHGSSTYGFEVDMWSIGCTLAEMILLEPVFQCESIRSEEVYMNRICQILGTPTVEEWPQLSSTGLPIHEADTDFMRKIPTELHDILLGMLRYAPSKRMTVEQVLNDPVFSPLKT